MSKITKEDLDIIRQYFLSFDEVVRNNIRSTISAAMIKYITIIENGFVNDYSSERISSELGIEQSKEISLLKNEYLIALAQASLEEDKNPDLEKINNLGNKSFQNILKELSYSDAFEKDMSIALKSLERDELKKRFQKYDEEDEFEIAEDEMRTAITSVERDSMKKHFKELDNEESNRNRIKLFFRYAIAAAIFGIIFNASYLLFFNQGISDKSSFVKKESEKTNDQQLAKVDLPNLINKTEYKKVILERKNSSAFALRKDSIAIEVKGLLPQIDTLQRILEGMHNNRLQREDLHRSDQILKQIDSLQSLLNTYIFNSNTRRVIVNLDKARKVESIISIDPDNLSKFYINIKGEYYLIETNTMPVKLIPIIDKMLIDSLKTIEFINE